MKRKSAATTDDGAWGVVAVPVGRLVAVVVLDTRNPTSPVPVEVSIRQPEHCKPASLRALLDAWTPPRNPAPVTTDVLRAVGLGSITAAWAAENASTPDADTLDAIGSGLPAAIDSALDIPWPPGGLHGFRRLVDLRAALTRAVAAQVYGRAAATGDTAPTLAVAHALNLDPTRARDVIVRARRDGYLTEGTQGRPGGVATPKALALISDVITYRKAPQP